MTINGDTQENAAYRPGDRDDFDRLYRTCYPRLLRTIYAITGDAASAEDCVQEAFLRAFKAWPRYRPERAAEAWIYQIAINTAISHRRRAKLPLARCHCTRRTPPSRARWTRWTRRKRGIPK